MDSYKIDIVRDRDISKQFWFTNRNVIELTKNNVGKTFIVTIKAYYINGDRRKKNFTSNPRKILTEATREIVIFI